MKKYLTYSSPTSDDALSANEQIIAVVRQLCVLNGNTIGLNRWRQGEDGNVVWVQDSACIVLLVLNKKNLQYLAHKLYICW